MPETPAENRVAVILGSGFQEFAASGAEPVSTDFGAPSAPINRTDFAGSRVLMLARHGDAHDIPPHRINYRANIAALRSLGARSIIALNTVGAISRIREPGQIGIPDQLLDYTWGREHTFHDGDNGRVEHIDFTEPFPRVLREKLLAAARRAQIDCFDGGVYATTQGPRLETAAEVDRLERDGADYVGMTAMPEAILAAEAGIAYACLAMVVNKAAGRGDQPIHADVEANTAAARAQALHVLEAFFDAEGEL